MQPEGVFFLAKMSHFSTFKTFNKSGLKTEKNRTFKPIFGTIPFEFYFRTLQQRKKNITTMKTETIRTITIEDFKHDPHLIDYVDDNLIVLDNAESTFHLSHAVKMDCFVILFCIEGEVTINISNKLHALKADHCALIMPGTVIRRTPYRGEGVFRIVAISSGFLKEITSLRKETWDIGVYVQHNPIFPITRNSSYKFYLYKELALTIVNGKENIYSKEAKKHLFAAIFSEILGVLHQNIPEQKNGPKFSNDRSMYIFRRFVEKVAEDDGSHRSVGYYANLLCYSPKHLSTVIKNISGKGPLTIINEHAIELIKYELIHSDKSIKEIADHFDFVNPSFFGKFVKQHLGMSPLQYRKTNTDK